MTIYIPMIILTVFLADIQERIRYRGRKISILLITLLPPTLVAAFRYNNGADYPMYFQLFTRLGNGSKIAGIEGKKLEVGFEYIVRLCQLVTRNQWFTFGAISFIISFLIFKECLNDSDDYRLSVLFYFVTGVYFDAYNGLRQYIAVSICFYGAFLKKCGELTQLLADNKRIAVICCQNYGRLMHLRLYKNVNAEIQEEWNAIVEILKQCNYDEDVYKNVLDAVEEYFRTLVQRKKEDKLFELERFMAQVYEENGRCEAAEVAALCLANLYNSGGHRKITPDEYETIKKYLQKFPESMHIRAAFIIASEAIYSPSAEYKRVPDKIINKAKQWSEQYPKKIEFQEAYFGLLFSRLKYAQAQDMRNEQRRVYREMKTVAERANYSEYNESNQLMESVDILHRVFGY